MIRVFLGFVMGRLSQDAFLTELSKLYSESKDKGSVVVSIKRVVPEKLNKSLPKDEKLMITDKLEPRCLIRAVDSKKRKISTTIATKDYDRFQGMFGNIIKVHMDSLKRVKRRKETTK